MTRSLQGHWGCDDDKVCVCALLPGSFCSHNVVIMISSHTLPTLVEVEVEAFGAAEGLNATVFI